MANLHVPITKYILKTPLLKSIFVPLAGWYGNAAGHRKLGLKCVSPRPRTHALPYPYPVTRAMPIAPDALPSAKRHGERVELD